MGGEGKVLYFHNNPTVMLMWLTHVNIIRIYAGVASSLLCAFGRGFDGEKKYLVSSIIMKIYPAISAAIGGLHGMDGGREHWMTLPFSEAFQMR